MKSFPPISLILFVFLLAMLSACGQASQAAPPVPATLVAEHVDAEAHAEYADTHAEDADAHAEEPGGHGGSEPVDLSDVDYAFTLETEASSGFLYRGEDGTKNPVLRVPAGVKVGLTVVNGDGVEHDLTIDVLGLHSDHVAVKGESSSIAFTAETPGAYPYYCTLPGHREAGMEGVLVVEGS